MNSIRIVLHSVSELPASISYACNLFLPVELVADESFTPTRTDSQCTPNRGWACTESIHVLLASSFILCLGFIRTESIVPVGTHCAGKFHTDSDGIKMQAEVSYSIYEVHSGCLALSFT